jgi:hypothetical protein
MLESVTPYKWISRLCVWLANLQPDVQKSFLKLFGQPRACGKPTDEERKLFPDENGQTQKAQDIRTELVVRRWLKLSLMESTVD